MTESKLQEQVCKYLSLQYPKCLYHSDFGSGSKLTIGQAMKQKRIQKMKGHPDLFIIEPRKGFYGLFLELKKDGEKLKKKNGDWVNDHVKDQAMYHEVLRERGYKAEFAVGFEQSKQLIDEYLK